MTAAEHAARAEQLLDEASSGKPDVRKGTIATLANVHATLALYKQRDER